jgi:RNA polymerase sigma-70 factor (ECF subfamily)
LARHYTGPEGLAKNVVRTTSNGFDPSNSTFNPVSLSVWTEFHEAVENLPEIERKIFDLLWYQEHTQAEAAKILGISERQLRRNWQSARLMLQDRLKSL